MSEERHEADHGPTGLRMIHVRLTDDRDAVGIGIYHVHPNGHPSVPGSEGQQVGELLAAIRLSEPEKLYEIAQKITMCAIKLEEERKGAAG
jgi:hypothetical protein